MLHLEPRCCAVGPLAASPPHLAYFALLMLSPPSLILTCAGGIVRIARSTITGEFAAVKKIKRPGKGNVHRSQAVVREMSMLKLVDEHPNIISLKDVFETNSH